MLIGEAAKNTGFTTDTIRWYEKIGLIKLERSSRNRNNYRSYGPQVLVRLRMIKQMKSFGFTLNEVEDLLVLIGMDELNCDSASEIIEPKLKIIDQKIRELQHLRSKLTEAQDRCTGNCIELFEQANK